MIMRANAWQAMGLRRIEELSRQVDRFTVTDVRVAMADLSSPSNSAAWANLIIAANRRGLIVAVGTTLSPRNHGLLTVWAANPRRSP